MAPQYAEEDIYADLVQQGMDVAEEETREHYLEDPDAMGNDLGVDSPDEAWMKMRTRSRISSRPLPTT